MSRRTRLLTLAFAVMAVCLLLALSYAQAAGDLSAKEARRLIARMAGIQLPSDAVRVKSVSSMGSSAVVEAQVETAFRFVRGEDGKWRVAEIRTGDNRWEDVSAIERAVNAEKAGRARAELETLATALEAYRRERGFYVVGTDERTLEDHLNPRYLARVIRVDPWHRPYRYEGTPERFTLRSNGADGEVNTPDDVIISNR
jgi:hypothetical protein